ncbi:unnamed protein product [Brassicogethes aeneus]|uniref:TGF-beta family profile domain-containing protein n=1 Tax=Brassicogethes aeneus TaxID=1431903 RepID=A0A9P0AUK2_BRAAE|nr:unnamed protein product [Brassicogethes aeneus]
MSSNTYFTVFLFLIILETSVSDKHINRTHLKKDTTPIGGFSNCGGCKMREELKQRNLEVIKAELLKKMGFTHPPNMTGKILPDIPPHILQDFEMQSDEPEFKTGVSVHEEEDEYHVKTQKVLTFAKPYPKLRHNMKQHEILHFTFSDSVTKFHVANATLFVFIKGAERRPLPDVHIEVFKVNKVPDHSEKMPDLKKVYNKKITQPYNRGEWIKIDFTETTSEWFKNGRENFGFIINTTVNGKKVSVMENQEKVPYVDISTTESRRRVRRSMGLNCNDSMQESLCCRYPLVVDFVQFGWDFVIAPKKYEANYCGGDCPYVTLQKYPHTHLMKMAFPNSAQPCCGPRKMSAISMLYFDESYNVVYGSLTGMVVDRCGCS